MTQSESIGRLISYSLRIGGEIEEIVKELKGIRCHQPADDVLSCADAVAQVLEERKEVMPIERGKD